MKREAARVTRDAWGDNVAAAHQRLLAMMPRLEAMASAARATAGYMRSGADPEDQDVLDMRAAAIMASHALDAALEWLRVTRVAALVPIGAREPSRSEKTFGAVMTYMMGTAPVATAAAPADIAAFGDEFEAAGHSK